MSKSIFGKVVAFIIVSLFVLTSMIPILESVALGKDNSSEPSFYTCEQHQSVDDTDNDYKAKPFALHYGYLHDVALTEVVSPESGLAIPQIPEVILENHGQNAESVNVSMTIGKPIYTTLLEEDFAGGVPPAGWTTDAPLHWMGSSTNYAGGTVPEAEFYYLNSDVGDFHLYTGVIDTTGFTVLGLNFKEFVNDYNGDYTLKVQTTTDGGVTWSDAYVRPGGPYGPATTEITLTAANGVGSPTLQISWTYSGNAFNINYWYIDDVWLGIIDMEQEYNETVMADIDPGETLNISLPEWTPADIPLATSIDYLIDTSVSLNMPDENPADNNLTKMITLSYEHDVGVIEITEPSWPLKRTGAPYWTDATDGDMAFQLSGQQPWGGPGTYPVEGIIQNIGVTYSESDIPVNAQITNNTGEVVYDETVIVTEPLTPGAIATVAFPDIVIPENVSWYGSIKLTMRTQLVGDDHPNNDKKIKTWYIPPPPDTTPPVTNVTVSGTMGHNGWYISCVIVTFIAVDWKWPSGVNHTYYKIDDGAWNEYTVPIVVCEDGEHTVYFYSDDRAMPPNIEEEKNVTFKIDQNPPSISMSVEKVGFRQYEFTATVSDVTSGMWYVELYFDHTFLENISAPGPYERNWTGKGNHTVTGIAYDFAGNSAENSVTFSLAFSQQHSLFNQVVSQAYRFIQLLKTIIMKLGMNGVRLLS